MITEKLGSFFAGLYIKYRFRLYPKIERFRGTTRLLNILEKSALIGIPKIDEMPVNIANEDWDNLIILDACRYDTYQDLRPEAENYRVSVGRSTPEFLTKTFSTNDFSDTVLVTANPQYGGSKFRERTGRELNDVFHTVFKEYKKSWNKEEGTVLAKDVCNTTRTANNLFPEKKILVHFLQPHYPFVDSRIETSGMVSNLEKEAEESAWVKAMKGDISHEVVVEGYERNLKYVLEEVEKLVEELDGKTVVTSDHGNLLGENGLYGHSMGKRQVPLRKVPWVSTN